MSHAQVSRATANHEVDYTPDQIEFLKAMERWKRENRRPFPTLVEVLEVARSLGWRKVAEATELPRHASEG